MGGVEPTAYYDPITNTGDTTMDPYGFSITGADAQDFELVGNTCDSALEPGATCDLDIAYFPPAEYSTDEAVLSFYDQLATRITPPGPDGLGSGRHILLLGDSFTGYYTVHASGALNTFGDAPPEGNPTGALNRPIVGMATVPYGVGYWMVASDGGIFSYGGAGFYGSTGGIRLNKPIVGMAATPDGGGYWLVASDGGVFAFGDARFYGSTGSIRLNKPIVGMAATPDGRGYWLVASDGGIFAFGDAGFYGSTGGMTLNQPIVGMGTTPDGRGYWLVASDGGIFAFGEANFHGSTGGIHLNKPVIGMAPTTDGGGYWLVASDGGIFAFGDAAYLGSPAGGAQDVVGIAALLPE